MTSKHIYTITAKMLLLALVVAVVLGIVAGSSFSAAPTTVAASNIPTDTKEQPNANPKLMGDSGLIQHVSAVPDTTPDHDAVVGSMKSKLIDYDETLDNSPNYPNIPSKALEKKAEAQSELIAEEDGFIYCPEIPLSEDLQLHTYQECQEKGLDYSIVIALMWRESRFNSSAIGYNTNGTRDHGIMQINDVNRGWIQNELGITDLMDAKQNITAGTEMLSRSVDQFGTHYGLLAYQYGDQGMKNRVARGITTSSQTELLYSKSAEYENLIEKYI